MGKCVNPQAFKYFYIPRRINHLRAVYNSGADNSTLINVLVEVYNAFGGDINRIAILGYSFGVTTGLLVLEPFDSKTGTDHVVYYLLPQRSRTE